MSISRVEGVQDHVPWNQASGLTICLMISPHLQFQMMLNKGAIRDLLEPFNVSISDDSIDKLIVYLNLLFHWNQKINLTAVRIPEECVTRHFGESFMLSRIVPLHGSLLDIGSGAGFPGLALKLVSPNLRVVLLEPVAKKRAFLKEVARTCRFNKVDVLSSRLGEYSEAHNEPAFDIVTLRAVGGLESLIPSAQALLKPNGSFCLWVGRQQVQAIRRTNSEIGWREPFPIPLSQDRLILWGIRGQPKSS